MSFLLDTSVVSEWMKPRPNPGVIAWLAEVDEDRVFRSVVTITELRYGIERLPPGNRTKRLQQWLEEELPLRFEGRLLNIDYPVAEACGKIVARSEALGSRMQPMDAFIAATAEVHRLVVITRNTADFRSVVKILNPWARRLTASPPAASAGHDRYRSPPAAAAPTPRPRTGSQNPKLWAPGLRPRLAP